MNWQVQAWKIWRGVDLTKPQWGDVNLIADNYRDAQDLVDYIQKSTDTPHRVVRK